MSKPVPPTPVKIAVIASVYSDEWQTAPKLLIFASREDYEFMADQIGLHRLVEFDSATFIPAGPPRPPATIPFTPKPA